MDTVALTVIDVEHTRPHEAAVAARCLVRLSVGATLHDTGQAAALRITTIERYPGVYVDAVEPPHAARIVLRGERANMIEPGAQLIIRDEQHAETSTHKS